MAVAHGPAMQSGILGVDQMGVPLDAPGTGTQGPGAASGRGAGSRAHLPAPGHRDRLADPGLAVRPVGRDAPGRAPVCHDRREAGLGACTGRVRVQVRSGDRVTEWLRGWDLLLRGIRVYELAKELEISSKDILRLLAEEMNIELNNHMATLNDQVVAKLRRLVAEKQGRTDGGKPPAKSSGAVKESGAGSHAPSADQPPRAPAPPVPLQAPARRAEAFRPDPRSNIGGLAVSSPARPIGPPARPTGGSRLGPVHFRPAPGLLPLVTPRPSPPRPKRAQPVRPEAPVAPAAPPPEPVVNPDVVPPTALPPSAAVPVTEEAPVQAVQPPVQPVQPAVQEPDVPQAVPPVAEPAETPPAAEPDQQAPEPVPSAPAEPESEPRATQPEPRSIPVPSRQVAPTPRIMAPSPRVAASAAPVMDGQARAGLLPVRKVTPGAPPPLRDPERPLLPIRKAEPRPAAGASAPASAAPAGAGADRAPSRGRKGADRRGPGVAGEGTIDPRRRGGAGHRPSRPGGVVFGESDASGSQGRRRARRRRRLSMAAQHAEMELAPPESISLAGPVLVVELAEMLRISPTEIIKKLMAQGVMATINHQLEPDQARAIALDLGIEVEQEAEDAAESSVDRSAVAELLTHDNPARRAQRPPIVAVLGHVDHGKTTLLDAIRSTRVAEGEAGGITQHIGAYVVRTGDRPVTFLDTPGHEAFTALRARGAQVTDIAVLVVAADDGIMPQTLEAISHARAAGVPIVVALNKIDKPNANPDRVLQQLAEQNLVPEAWGGDTIVVPVSALKREGIPQLLEMLMLVADVQELKADPERPAVGTTVEAEISRGRGPVATVLVQSGTLRVGDTFVAGQIYGRVRAMVDDLGRPVREAGPSVPVEVLGFEEVPKAGDAFVVMPEREAREVATRRQEESRREALAAERPATLADFRQEGDEKQQDLCVILKADVHGSLEALRGSLEKLHNDEVRVTLLHGGVGPVSESDVMLAATSSAVILGFNVRPDVNAEREAQRLGIEIKTYRIIYELLDDVQKALDGRLKPKFETVTLGHAEVRKPIRVPDIGVIAGSYVTDGLVRRGAPCRVVRGGTIVHEGIIGSLRRFKDDAREVQAGYECGIGLDRFNDVKEGDVIEALEEREIPR